MSSSSHPALEELREQIRTATAQRRPLCIRAGDTKSFYGNPVDGDRLDPRPYRGITAYDPSELVLSARAGTPLTEIDAALADAQQMLPFEPPQFGPGATLGGCIAAGLAGPRRASFGAPYGGVRDFVLGASLLDGRGELLRFGGTVMKNVAGYDVARLLAGSLGILGLITDASIKVLPRPAAELTLRVELEQDLALRSVNEWAAQPLPISATAWVADLLYVRLSGAQTAVQAAAKRLGGEALDAEGAAALWRGLRDQRHIFFTGDDLIGKPLWRISLPSTAPILPVPGTQLIEWSGALRWLRTDVTNAVVRGQAAQLGGHATLFRGGNEIARAGGVFSALSPAVAAIHKRLKAQFDPAGIFNPGRMYPEL